MSKTFGIPSDHPLPATARPGAVHLQVGNLERSVAFYTHLLGCEVQTQGVHAVTLGPSSGRALIHLHELRGARPVPARGHIGLYHFAILLPDREALGRFAGRLIATSTAAGSADHFVSESFYLRDPDGLGIEVYADRPREGWRTGGHELVMVTEPLDLRSVLDAGGGAPWTGLPRGTIIGHMHFSVDALDRAGAFFHAVLGFDKTVWTYPGALFLSAGGYHHHVATNTWAAAAPRAGASDARLLEWELMLPDRDAARAVAARAGAAGHPVSDADGDAVLEDPWGMRLRLRTEQ